MIDRISKRIPRKDTEVPDRHFSSPNCQRFQDGLGKAAFAEKTADPSLDDALKQRPSVFPSQLTNLEKDDAIYRWDQPGEAGQPARGWRLLSSQGKNKEALRQIDQVLITHPPGQWPSRLGRHIVAFHGLQLAVQESCPRSKIQALAKEAQDPKDEGWNAYVSATVCFALGDKRGFAEAMTMAEGNPNERVMRKLETNFGKKNYIEAYGS